MARTKNNAVNLEVTNTADGFNTVGGNNRTGSLGIYSGSINMIADTGGNNYTYEFPSASGIITTEKYHQTLENKTLDNPKVSGISQQSSYARVLVYDLSSQQVGYTASAALGGGGGGGSTSPGGSDTYIQYNESGVFGGESNFRWDYTSNKLDVTGSAVFDMTGDLIIDNLPVGVGSVNHDVLVIHPTTKKVYITGSQQLLGGGGSGSTSPGGSDNHVQYNENGVFGGKNTFTFNYNQNRLYYTGSVYFSQSSISEPYIINDIPEGTGVENWEVVIHNRSTKQLYRTASAAVGGGGGGGGGATLTEDVEQTSHGLSVGDVIRASGSGNTYTTAQADNSVNAEVVGIVTDVPDANNFTYTFGGIISSSAVVPTGSLGDALYLSPTTPGDITTTEPTAEGEIIKPIGIILDSNQKMLYVNMRGSEINNNGITDFRSVTIENPTGAEDITLFRVPLAITIVRLTSVLRGTTPSVTFTIRHNADRSATGNEVVTSGTTTTNTTSGLQTTVFNDATIPAGSWVWLETTATSGTVNEFNLTIEFTID